MNLGQPTLVEAFRLAGLEVETAVGPDIRAASNRVLFKELERVGAELAEGGHYQTADIEDATQVFFMRFLRGGPREGRHGLPESDKHVRNYLFRALINNLRTILDGEGIPPEPPPLPESPEDHIIASIELGEARRQLFDKIIPALTSSKAPGAGASFAKTVRQLRSVADGELRFDVLLAEELAFGPTRRRAASTAKSLKSSVPSESERAAARLYTRFSRVLAEIEEAISADLNAGQISRERFDALLVVIDELRLRPA